MAFINSEPGVDRRLNNVHVCHFVHSVTRLYVSARGKRVSLHASIDSITVQHLRTGDAAHRSQIDLDK